MAVQISIDTRDLQRAVKKLLKLEKDMRPNIAKAINKGLDVGKPQAETMISSIYNVPTPALGLEKANAGKLEGNIKGSGGMIPVSQFDPVAVGRSVSVSIIRGTRHRIMSTNRGRGGGAFFLPDGRVFARRGDSRYPIAPVMAIGIPRMLGSKKVSEPVRENMTNITMQELTNLIFRSMK
jgi:hypothetical protein